MNFIIMLALKYVFFTVMMFLTGVLMYCLFNGECLEQMEYEIFSKRNEDGENGYVVKNVFI